jgi:PAS domain S-box-containing protein
MLYLKTTQPASLRDAPSHFAPRARIVSQVSALLVGAIGAIVLIGWWLRISLLMGAFAAGHPIAPNIGAFTLICAASLALLSNKQPSRQAHFFAAVFAWVVICFALLTLTESIFGLDLKIDRVLVPGQTAPSENWQWRMMPSTAFSFAVIAVALLMAAQTPTRMRRWLISGLCASQLIPAVIALAGFSLEKILESNWNLMGMRPSSVPVAISFSLLSAGLLAAQRSRGAFSWSLDRLTTSAFALGVLIMLTVTASVFSFAKQMSETNGAISHRQELLKDIEEVAVGVSDLDSAQKGYAITGDSALLRDRERTKRSLDENLEDIRKVTLDEPDRQRDFRELRALLSQQLEWENNVIRTRNEGGAALAAKLIATGRGSYLLQETSDVLGKMRQREYHRLADDKKQAQRASEATFLLLPMGVFLSLAVLSLGFFLLNSGMGERAQSEKALAQAERKYRGIFENAVAGIFQSHPDGSLISANPALARMCGYSSPQEMIDSVSDVSRIYVDPQRRVQWKQAIEAKGYVNQFEYELYRKDGSRVWLSQNCRAVRNSDGTTAYYEGTLQDISEHRRIEEIERVSKAKSEFLSRISHELRTPLNAILGFGQLLERQNPTDSQRSHIGYIVQAGHHLLDLINEVLDISRIEAGRLQLSVEPVCVEEVLNETLDLVRPLAAEHSTTLSAPANEEETHYVMADRQRLKQTLINLLANAVKYSPDGSRVTCSLDQANDQTLRILVKDTGPGIPEEKISRLFRPFDRLDAEQSGTEGTGLGLALSKRLVEAMNGSIGVESKVGQGSTFWVELPRTIAPSGVKGMLRRITTISTDANVFTDKQRILYVEDNRSNVVLVEQLLEERPDLELHIARSGEVALNLAGRHLPNLILLDLHLPGLSGAEVLARLKQDEVTSQIPVIIISADATRHQIERLLAKGAQDYLTKPIDVSELFSAIDRALKIKDSSKQLAAA